MKPSIQCRTAFSQRELDDAVRIRFQVFGQEKGYVQQEPSRVSRELDHMDTLASSLHIVAYVEGEAAGAARLLLSNPEVARENGLHFGLGLEFSFDLGELVRPGFVPAETTRVCVLDRFRAAGVFEAVYAALLHESLSRGVTHWVAAANTETDDLSDAGIVHRVAQYKGLVSERWAVSSRSPPSTPGSTAPRHALYTPSERARAETGDLRGLRLPRTLLLFARKGARFIGPPIYDARFRMCAMPLLVQLSTQGVSNHDH